MSALKNISWRLRIAVQDKTHKLKKTEDTEALFEDEAAKLWHDQESQMFHSLPQSLSKEYSQEANVSDTFLE